MTVEEKVIASYLVKVTLRGDEQTKAPTNTQVEAAVRDALARLDTGLAVRASAERTDK
jgi:hypothetical protein